MNTHLWASMEADSGGPTIERNSLEWADVAVAQARYRELAGEVLSVLHLTSLYYILVNLAPKVIGYRIGS